MTQPTRPGDRQFARDVAAQIDRRRVKRRLTLWSALLALVAAAAAYLRCGNGLGLGGFGVGDGGREDQAERRTVAGPARCAIQISADGFTVAGKLMSQGDAVAACKGATDVDVSPTGDARHGDIEELRSALLRAGFRNGHIAIHPVPRPSGATPEQPRGAPGDAPRH